MPKSSVRVEFFISSPSDMAAERSIALEVINQVNHDIGAIEGFHLVLLSWENNTYSAKGEYAQSVINDQIGMEYDIFLGMMASRYGSVTRQYDSGTVEEYERALERHSSQGLPEIAFLFSDTPKRPSEINLEDQQKIDAFRKRIGASGVLYKSFQDETQLRLHLWRCLVGLGRKVISKSVAEEQVEEVFSPSNRFDPCASRHELLARDSEVNAFILAQIATDRMKSTKQHLERITAILSSANKIFISEARRIRESRTNKLADAMRIASARVSLAMTETSDQLYRVLPKLHEDLQESLVSTQRSLEIFASRKELDETLIDSLAQPLSAMRHVMSELATAIKGAGVQIEGAAPRSTNLDVQSRVILATFLDAARIVEAGIASLEALDASMGTLVHRDEK